MNKDREIEILKEILAWLKQDIDRFHSYRTASPGSEEKLVKLEAFAEKISDLLKEFEETI